ncbi:hypothetical protein ES703_30141 [subsurface metagenome]
MENKTYIWLIVGISLIVLTSAVRAQDKQWLQYHSARDSWQLVGNIGTSNPEVVPEKPRGVELPDFKCDERFFARWPTPMVASGGLWMAFDRKSKDGPHDLLYMDLNGNGSLADGLAFDLEEVSVADVDFSGPSRPRLLRRSGMVRRSKIKIDGIEYDVFLAPYRGTDFCLIPKSNPQNYPRWWGADKLNATHAIGGKYYSFAKTPEGNKLLVRPFHGDFGTFEVGAGGRNIQEIAIQGSLRSEDTAVAVGGELENGWPKPAKSCRLPVGDYLPAYLTITFGRLSIGISNNYHADGQPRRPSSHPPIYGIKIREGIPMSI